MTRRRSLRTTIICAFLVVAAVLALAPACRGSAPSPAPAPGPAPAPPAKPAFPEKEITWIVPYSTGGGFDLFSRVAGQHMSEAFGVPVVVKNTPGAAGQTGTVAIYRAQPDGYTMGIINGTGLGTIALLGTVQYDLEKFVYLGQMNRSYLAVTVSADSPFRSLEDLRGAKKPVRFAISTATTVEALAAILLTKSIGIPMTLVTGYTSTPQVQLALQRGDADAALYGIDPFASAVAEGTLRMLVTFAPERAEYVPKVPTLAELGQAKLAERMVNLSTMRVVVATPGTPKERAAVLENALKKATESNAFRQLAQTEKLSLGWLSGEDTRKAVLASRDIQGEILKEYADEVKRYQ